MMKFGFSLVFALIALPAFAAQTLNFEQLRDACKNPAKYHSQVQPTGIKIDCMDRQFNWIPAEEDSGSLARSRTIGSSISSDKYTVPANHSRVELPPVQTSCPVYKQVEETLTLSQSLTCDQILDFKGSDTDLCKKMIDDARTDNPSVVKSRETGRERHLCNQPEDRGQRGQRDSRGQRSGDQPAPGAPQDDDSSGGDDSVRFSSRRS